MVAKPSVSTECKLVGSWAEETFLLSKLRPPRLGIWIARSDIELVYNRDLDCSKVKDE